MKIVVIQEEIIQTDITPKELTKRWKKLEQLPGIDEVVIEVPAHYPNIEQLHTYIGDADAVFGLWIGPDNMNEAFLSQHPNLKYVATLGHGWEKFDTEMTRKRGISISNTIYGSQTIAEYAFALLMDVCHHIVSMLAWGLGYFGMPHILLRFMAIEDEKKLSLSRKVATTGVVISLAVAVLIGVIGLGAIGFAFAKMAQGFGMHVLAYSRHKKEGAAYDFIEQVSLDELLARSDFISLHTPHTPATEHMIDQNTIARMKDGVILINTARGALIDEQALADALASGKVLAAGLDVLTDEPPVHGSPLLTAPNTVITGHIAWLTRESRIRAIDMAIDNFRCYLEGHPVSIIN